MTQLHIMLDLETWGTEPGCDIRSIGACVFDPQRPWVAPNLEGQIHETHFYIACNNPAGDARIMDETVRYYDGVSAWRKYPLTRDPRTVQWWNDQSAEARGAFTDPVDLRDALKRFDAWLTDLSPRTTPDRQSPQLRLWAHGPSFDVSILAAAYKAVGLPVPWHYRAPRDTRTAFDMAGIEDHSAFLNRFNTGTHHNALDDAITQARAVCNAMGLVRVRNNKSLDQNSNFASTLRNVIRDLHDEGDRVYLGSTNDADDLRQIYNDMQTAWEWDELEADDGCND